MGQTWARPQICAEPRLCFLDFRIPPRLAASDNVASWSTFQQCVDALPQGLALWQQRPREAYRGGGIGFVFSKLSQGQGTVTPTDPYTGVDLDHCRDPETGMIMPWPWHLIPWLKSYAEVSPSGTGVKIFLQATLPGSGVNKHFLEIYDRGRFFTVTGWHVPGTPGTIEPRQSHIEALYTVHHLLDLGLQRYGERFSLLLAGHWEQVQRVPGTPTYRSHSEADLALCALLATVGATGEQIDTCIRLSGLSRPKWDEQHGTHTYEAMTIAKALRRRDGPPPTVSRRPDVPQQRQRALRQDNAAEAPLSWEPPVPFHDFALPAFPIAALPENLQHDVMALAQATQTPCDLAGALVLAVCAWALAKKVVVCIRPGYIEPVNLFMAGGLPPGNRKSTVFAAVVEPIQVFAAAETQRLEPYIAAAESQRRIAEKTLQQVEVRAAKAESTAERRQLMAEAEALARDLAALRVPARPRLVTDDTPPERLATLLSLHEGHMAGMSPEGGEVFDHMRGRYTPNHLPNFGVYLKGHTGDTLRVDRVNRPAEYVQQPALTVALTMQPEVLHGLMDKAELRGHGLLGRFLYAMPASLLGRRRTDVPPVPETIHHAYSSTITRLLTLACDTDDPGQPVAHILQLAPTAGRRLHQCAAWLEPQLGPFGELGAMTDWAGKLVGAVARLAGIFHMVEHAGGAAPWEMAISPDSVEHAIALGAYFLQHARAAYAEMGTDPVMADAKYVLEWSSRAEIQHFTKREAFEGTRGRFKRVAALEPGLQLLMEHNFIRQRDTAARPGPGRKPSPTYDVNPFSAQKAPHSPNATHRSYSAHSANST